MSSAAVVEASECLLDDSKHRADISPLLASVAWLTSHSRSELSESADLLRLVLEPRKRLSASEQLLSPVRLSASEQLLSPVRLSDGGWPRLPVLDGLFALSLTLPFARMRRSRSEGDSEVSRPVAESSSNCQEQSRTCCQGFGRQRVRAQPKLDAHKQRQRTVSIAEPNDWAIIFASLFWHLRNEEHVK